MTGLRARQRADLRARVDRVALELFAERGFDAVSVDEIAAAAGISLSTLFRHVRSKDQLLVGTLRLGRAEIGDDFAARPATEPVPAALAAAILHQPSSSPTRPTPSPCGGAPMAAAPVRVRRASLLDDDERARLVVLVAERLGLDPEADLRVRVALAAAEQAYEHWLTRDTGRSLHDLTREALVVVS